MMVNSGKSILAARLSQKPAKSSNPFQRLSMMIAALITITFISAPEASAYPTAITFDIHADTGEFYLVNSGISPVKYKLSVHNRKMLMHVWASEGSEAGSGDLLAAVIFFSEPGHTKPRSLVL